MEGRYHLQRGLVCVVSMYFISVLLIGVDYMQVTMLKVSLCLDQNLVYHALSSCPKALRPSKYEMYLD